MQRIKPQRRLDAEMKIKLIPILAFYLFTFAFAAFAQTGANATWRVQKYDLNVTLPQDERSRVVTARAVLSIKNVSGSPAGTLTLRISTAAEVTSVKINDAVVDFTKAEEKAGSLSLQRIGMRFGSLAPESILTAAVEYKLNIKENSGVAAFAGNGGHFLPLSFWYPTPNSWYFTRGADTAPVRLKVVAANGAKVVSSGVETAGTFDQKLNGQPFFVDGNWDMSNQNGVAVYAPKGANAEGQKRAAELAAIMSEAKTYITGVLGNAPDVPLRIVANRRGGGYGSGGTVIVDEAVFRRSKVDSLTAMSIAESVAKMWLGNAVSLTGDGSGVRA